MNKIYKLKFDKRRNELVVVSEIAAGTGKEKNTGHIAGLCNVSTFRKRVGTLTPLAFLTGLIISLFPGMALANPDLPTGGQIVGGQGSISTSGNQMTIQQHTQNMVTNWHSFDIGKNNTVQFVQPDSSSVALNRVTGASGSQIMGTLKANGQVFILNPNGVLFGKDARVNVAGLVASTKNINTADFMKGQYTLSGEGNPGAQVINQGGLTTTKGGYIVLAADQVKNSGTITTPSGKTVLAAGKTVTLQLDNGGLTSVSVDGSVVNALVENRGLISATDGRVFLTAQGKDMLLNTVVNNSGTIEAKGLESRGGEIVLNGGDSGVVNQSGQLLADSHAGPGGKITVEGQNIHLATNSRTSATGKTGGGEVYVGGGWQGKDSHIRNASKVVMDKTATVDVSATGAGNGGTAVLWSDDYTNFRGAILAKGGALSGDGGRVETSSHKNLQAFGDVDASASAGHGGEWLLDPLDVTIVSGDVNANVTESGNSAGGATPADTDHVFSPSASGAQVSAQKISDQLNNGTSVTVDTHGDGDQAGNITFNGNATVKKTAGGDATLTLKADKDITFVDRSWSEPTDESNGAIVSTSGKLNMNLLTGNSGQNGTIAFGKYVRLYLNGGDILAGPANASAGSTGLSFSNAGAIHAGNITLNASGGVTGNYYTLDAAGDLTVKGPLSLNAGYKLTSNIKAGGHLNITASSGDIRFSAGTVNGEAAGGKILIEGKDGVNIRADNGHLVMNVVNKTINTINVSSSDGPVTLSGKVQDGSVGLTLTNVSISSKGQTTIDGTTYFGKATVLSGLNITATGDVNINGTARRLSDGLAGGSSSEGVWVGASNITSTEGNVSLSGFSGTDPKNQGHGAVGVGNSNITANAGKILLNGTTQSTTGLMVTGSNFSAASMDVKGVATIRGTGFTLTNSHLLGNLTDLTHVVFSSAGSAAGVTNLLDNSIVTTSNRDTLLKWHPENMTQINMGGDAIFDDSSNAAKGWVADFTSDSTPNGGWIFGDTKVIAGGDVSLKGVGFANSTVNISSGNLSISNSGSVFLSGSDVSASGDVVLSSVNGTVNINNINSKRTTVTSEHGSITVKANPGSAGSGYSVSLNGADLKSSTGTEITGINTGSGGAGGVYLANTNISAGEGIDINGSALSGSYSGVFLGNSVNLTAVGDINIIGHSSGPANRAYGSPDAGVYLSGRGSTLSAANINISGYNPQLKNSAGIIIGQTDVVNTPGASFTFNGNTSLYGDGGAFGIDLGVKSPNTLVFNNGNVSLTGIQRGPRDVQGTGGISAVSINAGGTLQSVNNIVTSNVSHFTINGTTGSADSRVPGIGTAGLNNQVDIINNIKINFSGQVGRLDIKGTANSGSAVNTQVFNASSLNATEGIFIQGESKSGTGVVLSQGDYSNNKVNIVGKSTSGNAVRLDNNTSLANASISGTSDTGSGVVFNGATHNLTDVTVTGQTGGATGNGILINGLTGTNVSIQGTSNGTSGIGINLAGPVQLSGNTRLDGESPTGTGLRVVQKVDVGAGSKVTLAGTSTSGTGVALRNSVNGGSVNGTSGSGAGVVLGDNAKVTSTGIFGQSTSGTGVSIEGKVSLDEASAGLLNATSDSGAGLGLRNNTVLGVVQNGGVTPVTVPVVLTGTSQTGSGVATSGNVSISGVTLKGTSTVDGSAGVTLGGKLTVADDISGVAASATGNGTALVINGAVDAKGYTEAGKDFVIGATVNGDGTAISVSGNSSLSNVALNGTATGNGSAVVVSGSLSTDKTLTATSQGQEGTGLQLSGGHLQGTTADDSPVKVVVSAAGDGTAVSVTKSDTGQSGSGLSGITLVASADRGPVLDIAGDLVTDADISVSTEHGTAISLNGGSLQGADAGHPVTVTAGATGSGTAVIVKPVAEGQPGSTLANVTLNVTSVQGDALNVEGKLNTKDVSVAAATTGTGTALNVSGGEIHSLGGTDITATSDSGHAAVVKDGKFTGDSSGGLEVTATTTTDSPALNISGTSEVSNSVLSGKNSGNGSAVTVAGTVTSSGGGEIKGQTVNGIAVETADGTSVTAAQDGGLLINATATGDKGTGVVLTNATLTGSGVHADVTQGDAVTVTGSLTGGKVSGHANGGT
ncbi:filamentous hemagglutinin N-terminal domain-containing protein, partial [Salmonella enterica subsp. diarizonae serovar 50:r:z]|nr:filamentous hemagglutinin N-terminal domain-containing protein [Salmonella enterica subsp. diarizonae serovar 50:r:z]